MQWDLGISAVELYEVLYPTPSFISLTDQLFMMARNRTHEGSSAWGDKTPHYLGDWKILKELFPDAKFIFIARDGRDVALSLFQKPWGPSTTIGCAKYWARLNSEKINLKQGCNANQLLCLTYEELTQSPKIHIQKIYNFLNEPLSSELLEELSASTRRKNTNKWHSLMSTRQKRQFEAVAGDQLIAMGYALSSDAPKLLPGELLASRYLEFFNRFRFLFYINVVEGFKIRFLGHPLFAD